MRTTLVVVATFLASSLLLAAPTGDVHAKSATRLRYQSLRSGTPVYAEAGRLVRGSYDSSGARDADSLFHEGSFIYVPKATPEPETELFYGGSFTYLPAADANVDNVPAAEHIQTNSSPTAIYTTSLTSEMQAGTTAPVATSATPLYNTQVDSQIGVDSAQYAGNDSSIQFTNVTSIVATTGNGEAAPSGFSLVGADLSSEDPFHPGEYTLVVPEGTGATDANFYGDSFVLDDSTNQLRPANSGGLIANKQLAYASVRTQAVETVPAAPYELPVIVEPATGSESMASVTAPPATAAVNLDAGLDVGELLPSYYERSALPITGKAMYYNPGVMQYVLDYRLDLAQVEQCPECVGYVALLRAGDLNRRVWIQWPDTGIEGPYLVTDVAAQQHVSMLMSIGWVVDVDYRTAMRHGMSRPVTVTVLGYEDVGAWLQTANHPD